MKLTKGEHMKVIRVDEVAHRTAKSEASKLGLSLSEYVNKIILENVA